MRTNSLVGSYAYANAGRAEHAPSTVTPASGPAQVLAYDLNGNQTTGLDGKVMTYDGENRPVSVSFAGKTTTYVYGADGARLKKVESDPLTGTSVTLYLGAAEIRKYGQGTAEEILLYPQPNIRITRTKSGSTVTTKVSALHADGLGSVRAVTDGAGAVVERTTYRPFGEEVRLAQPLTLAETKGFIGERFDDGAGLQYLNARYYDPRLAMFIQPDWWEVTQAGVGTNRYSYSFNDPVNGRDPGGNGFWSDLGKAVRDFFHGFASGAANSASLDNTAAGLVGGAAIGATYGGLAGVGAGCAVSGCATSPVLGGGGFVGGGLIVGALGGSAGLVKDVGNVIGGGFRGGVEAVQNGSIAKQEASSENTTIGSNPKKSPSGQTIKTDKPGGIAAAEADFEKYGTGKTKTIPDGTREGTRVKENGVRIRRGSDGRPRVDVPAGEGLAPGPETIHYNG